ncbi:MAG: hypothetical protein LBL66_05695 [Clostridiales bacterium]|nr:hypothetical protein [Clostridiales bacterium]
MKNRTTHKILTALLAALLCLPLLAACGGGDGVKKSADGAQFDFPGNYAQPEITIDGKDTDGAWAALPALTTFGKNDYAAKVKMFRGAAAFFFWFEVSDYLLFTKAGDSIDDVTHGDSVEIYFDTTAAGGERPQTKDFQFNFGIDGKARILRGTGRDWVAWNGLIDYAVDLYGELNGGVPCAGYTMEVMIPYAQIGIERASEVGIAFAQVDKWSAGNVTETDYDWFGWRFQGELVEPQRPSNYIFLSANNTLTAPDDVEKPLCTLAGHIADGVSGAAVAGAQITVAGIAGVTVTSDAAGYFALPGVSPDSPLTLNVAKGGYYGKSAAYTRAEMRAANGGSVVKEIKLYDPNTVPRAAVIGKLKNAATGFVDGATVAVPQFGLSAVTAGGGAFRVENVPLTDDAALEAFGTNYETVRYPITGTGTEIDAGELDFCRAYSAAVKTGGQRGINEFAVRVTRAAGGLRFTYDTAQKFPSDGRVFLYLQAKTGKPIALWLAQDGRKGDDKSGDNAFAHPSLSAVTAAFARRENPAGGAAFTVGVPYALLGIAAADTFGFSAGVSSGTDWDGAVFDGVFINPDAPDLYIQVSGTNGLSLK